MKKQAALLRTATLGAAAMVASGISLAVPATAGDVRLPLTESQLRSASLKISDVPRSFSDNPSRTLAYAKGANTNRFEMCVDSDGEKVFGARPAQRMNSTVSLAEELDADGSPIKQRVVSSDIYGYTSVAVAKKSWKKLTKATKRCAKVINKPFQQGDLKILADVTQKTKKLMTINGSPGFPVKQQVAIDIGSGAPDDVKIYVGGFSAYRQTGTTILRVQFANYSTQSKSQSKIKKTWAAFTRDESVTVADRVAQLSVRN